MPSRSLTPDEQARHAVALLAANALTALLTRLILYGLN